MVSVGSHKLCSSISSVFFAIMLLATPLEAGAATEPTLILVDKKTNTLEVATYADDGYRTVKKFHTTIGRVVGDKEEEGDLKTPEGVYTFNARLTPPTLKKKFGVMAFYMNYPNRFDQMAGRTGSHIMLHATDQPERLAKDFDSEGCVVVRNEELKEIEPYVRLNLTPILVFAELTDDYRKPAADPRLRTFFESWVKAWEQENVDDYITHYHSEFVGNGMNRDGWKRYKSGLNQKYDSIKVNPSHIQFFRHPKYTVVMFRQDYRSTFKGGRAAFTSSGTKILHVAEEDGQPKIISEDFTQVAW